MAEVESQYDVAILGPGAVGAFLAGAFEGAGRSVVCITKPSRVDQLNSSGISIDSKILGKKTLRPLFVSRLRQKVKTLFITTKSYDLIDALAEIEPQAVDGAAVVPLLNGIDHMNLLHDRFPGSAVIAGTISIEAQYLGPGKVAQTSSFARMALGTKNLNSAPLLVLKDLLTQAHIEFSVMASEEAVLWNKLARLNALACTTALSQKPIGILRVDPFWRDCIINLLREASKVAEAEGVFIDPDAELRHIDGLPEGLGTSMQRDLAAGKPVEVDAILGGVLRRAKAREIHCPTLQWAWTQFSERGVVK